MKLLFVSLGCDKNLVDSEEMLARIMYETDSVGVHETFSCLISISVEALLFSLVETDTIGILEMYSIFRLL